MKLRMQLYKYLDQQILLQIQQRQFSDRSRKFLDFIQVKVIGRQPASARLSSLQPALLCFHCLTHATRMRVIISHFSHFLIPCNGLVRYFQ